MRKSRLPQLPMAGWGWFGKLIQCWLMVLRYDGDVWFNGDGWWWQMVGSWFHGTINFRKSWEDSLTDFESSELRCWIEHAECWRFETSKHEVCDGWGHSVGRKYSGPLNSISSTSEILLTSSNTCEINHILLCVYMCFVSFNFMFFMKKCIEQFALFQTCWTPMSCWFELQKRNGQRSTKHSISTWTVRGQPSASTY